MFYWPVLWSRSRPEPDFFSGAGVGAGEKEPAPAPACCDLGVLRWQSCGNSYNRYTFLLFYKTEFFSLNLCSKFFSGARAGSWSRSPDLEPEPVKVGRLHITATDHLWCTLTCKKVSGFFLFGRVKSVCEWVCAPILTHTHSHSSLGRGA